MSRLIVKSQSYRMLHILWSTFIVLSDLVVVIVFYVSPAAKVITRQGLELNSHQKD